MRFSELKKNVANHPDGLSDKEELAWRCMNYLNALYQFKHIDAKQVKQELTEIEFHFMHSLSPHEKVMQEIDEGGSVLSVAYHLMAAQPDRKAWESAMREILNMVDLEELKKIAGRKENDL